MRGFGKTMVTLGLIQGFLYSQVQAQSVVPIDLSNAKEFKTVWKKQVGGNAPLPPALIVNPCGVDGKTFLKLSTTKATVKYYSVPRLDTTTPVPQWGSSHNLFDYDGVPPLEYINDNGLIERCQNYGQSFDRTTIDTIQCWAELNASLSADVDGDGYQDLVCDVGGGGLSARIIRGGPSAGKGCDRVLEIARPNPENATVLLTCAFWQTSAGTIRLMQVEGSTDDPKSKVAIYDVQVHREGEQLQASFQRIDAIPRNGFGGSSYCAIVKDTIQKKDWLLMYRWDSQLDKAIVDRFDATQGRFTLTGDRVYGVEFLNPWVVGYEMGTERPVVEFGSGLFAFVDDLAHPFGRFRFKDSGVQPLAGWVCINDQTGDGKPDLVVAGGTPNGTLALLSLDSTLTTVDDSDAPLQPTVRIVGSTLEVNLIQPTLITAQIVTTDGRTFPALPSSQGVVGVNRFDLTPHLAPFASGAYLIRVRTGETLHTLTIIR